MKTKNEEYTIKTREDLTLENSFCVIREQSGVELEITLGFKNKEYGYFEFYDVETGGEDWYAEGGLWIEGKEIVDYDGVFSLPISLIKLLNEKGYSTDQI